MISIKVLITQIMLTNEVRFLPSEVSYSIKTSSDPVPALVITHNGVSSFSFVSVDIQIVEKEK